MQDCPDILEGIRNGDLADSVPGSERIRSLDDATAMVAGLIERAEAGEELHFSILEKGKVIGMCAIYGFDRSDSSARIGFWVNKVYRGRGYGKAAARLLVEIAFKDAGVKKVIASSKPSNKASLALLRSLGFREEAEKQNSRNGEMTLSLSMES